MTPVLDACLPPTNEAIIASGAWTIGYRQIAPDVPHAQNVLCTASPRVRFRFPLVYFQVSAFVLMCTQRLSAVEQMTLFIARSIASHTSSNPPPSHALPQSGDFAERRKSARISTGLQVDSDFGLS